jgi:tRNA threonylcarbamoyladenosine modification (KEOPS) complex  Pcc1 subunit
MKATIVVDYDSRILEIFKQEDKNINRASYTIEQDEKIITFHIKAEDATSLRTVFNAITKLLSIWEKSEGL